MRSDPGSSQRKTLSYFVLPSDGGGVEVARMNRRGQASYYDPGTDTWINDPLLASEILNDAGWRPAEADQLPDGIELPEPVTKEPSRQKRRRGRRGDPMGRHSTPKEA